MDDIYAASRELCPDRNSLGVNSISLSDMPLTSGGYFRLADFRVLELGECGVRDPSAETDETKLSLQNYISHTNYEKFEKLSLNVSTTVCNTRDFCAQGVGNKWDMTKAVEDPIDWEADQFLFEHSREDCCPIWLSQMGYQGPSKQNAMRSSRLWASLLFHPACHILSSDQKQVEEVVKLLRPESSHGAHQRLKLFRSREVRDELQRWWSQLIRCPIEVQRHKNMRHSGAGAFSFIASQTLKIAISEIYHRLAIPFIPKQYCLACAEMDVARTFGAADLLCLVSYSSFCSFLLDYLDAWTETCYGTELLWILEMVRKDVGLMSLENPRTSTNHVAPPQLWQWCIPLRLNEEDTESGKEEHKAWIEYPSCAGQQLSNLFAQGNCGCHTIVIATSIADGIEAVEDVDEVKIEPDGKISCFRGENEFGVRLVETTHGQCVRWGSSKPFFEGIPSEEGLDSSVECIPGSAAAITLEEPGERRRSRRGSLEPFPRGFRGVHPLVNDIESLANRFGYVATSKVRGSSQNEGKPYEEMGEEQRDESPGPRTRQSEKETIDWSEKRSFLSPDWGSDVRGDQSGHGEHDSPFRYHSQLFPRHWTSLVDFDSDDLLAKCSQIPKSRITMDVLSLRREIERGALEDDTEDPEGSSHSLCPHVVSGVVLHDNFSSFEVHKNQKERLKWARSRIQLLGRSGHTAQSDEIILRYHDEFCQFNATCTLQTLLCLLASEDASVDGALVLGSMKREAHRSIPLDFRIFKSRSAQCNRAAATQREIGTASPGKETSDGILAANGEVETFCPAHCYSFDVFISAQREVDAMIRRFCITNGGLPIIRHLVQLGRANGAGIHDVEPRFVGANRCHITLVIEAKATCAPGPGWEMSVRQDKCVPESNFRKERNFYWKLMDKIAKTAAVETGMPKVRSITPLGGLHPFVHVQHPPRRDTDGIPSIPMYEYNFLPERVPLNRRFATSMQQAQSLRRKVKAPEDPSPKKKRSIKLGSTLPDLLQRAGLSPSKTCQQPGTHQTRTTISTVSSGLEVMQSTHLPPSGFGIATFRSMKMGDPTGLPVSQPRSSEDAFVERMYKESRSRSPDAAYTKFFARRLEDYDSMKLVGATEVISKRPRAIASDMLNYSSLNESGVLTTTVGPNVRQRPSDLRSQSFLHQSNWINLPVYGSGSQHPSRM